MKILFTFLLLFSLFFSAEAQPCPNIGIGVSVQYVSCATCSNGSATITVLGGNAPYLYNLNVGLSTFVSNPTFNNLSMGTYTVDIIDTNSCHNIISFVIMDSTTSSCVGFSGAVNTTDCTTAAMCDGNAEVVVSNVNGIQPVFQWAYNQTVVSTDSVATNLCPGYYSLYISDIQGQGCILQTAVAIQNLSGGNNNVVVVGNPNANLSSISSEWINNCAIDLSILDTAYLVSANYGNNPATQDSLYTVWYISDTTGASILMNYVYYYPSSFVLINLILAVYCPFKSNPHYYNIISTFDPNLANVSSTDFIHYNIYPNPTSGLVTIKTNKMNLVFSILDLSGKILLTTSEKTIDISGFADGFYLIQSELGTFRLQKMP